MKDKLTSNLGLKLVSLLCALGLWLIVVHVDDPVTTKKFKNIPVKILNESMLDLEDEVYEVLENSDVITVTVKAKRSIIEALEESDFSLTADFAERISANSIPIRVKLMRFEDKIMETVLQNNTVKISVEKREYKLIPVELSLHGTVAEGFTVGSTSVSPNSITIAGTADDIAQVEKVVIDADINAASADISALLSGKLCNGMGDIIDESRIERSIEQYQIYIKLLHTKSIDLNFELEGEVATGYRYIDMEYTPTTITIAGELRALEAIDTLKIPGSELNITDATGNIVKKVDVSKYLPSGLIFSNNDEKEITVTLKVEELGRKTLQIQAADIDTLNTPSGMSTFIDNYEMVNITIRGLEEDLQLITEEDIKLSVDLKGKQVGVHSLQTSVKSPEGIIVETAPVIRVLLKESSTPTTESPSDNTWSSDVDQSRLSGTSSPMGEEDTEDLE